MPCAGFRLAGSMPSPAQIRNDFLSRNDFLPVQENPQLHPQVRRILICEQGSARDPVTKHVCQSVLHDCCMQRCNTSAGQTQRILSGGGGHWWAFWWVKVGATDKRLTKSEYVSR